MSRLGDLIRTERLRSKMTPKQVARKCGVSESYLLAVEAGTKIIADDQARRILKTIGLREQTEADFSLDDIAATVDLASASPAVAKAVERPKPQPEYELVATTKTADKKQDDNTDKDENVTGSVWLDALTSVLKRVPIMNAVMQPVDYRLMPIQSGKIEGAKPDKVFYFLAPDDSMRGFRIHSAMLKAANACDVAAANLRRIPIADFHANPLPDAAFAALEAFVGAQNELYTQIGAFQKASGVSAALLDSLAQATQFRASEALNFAATMQLAAMPAERRQQIAPGVADPQAPTAGKAMQDMAHFMHGSGDVAGAFRADAARLFGSIDALEGRKGQMPLAEFRDTATRLRGDLEALRGRIDGAIHPNADPGGGPVLIPDRTLFAPAEAMLARSAERLDALASADPRAGVKSAVRAILPPVDQSLFPSASALPGGLGTPLATGLARYNAKVSEIMTRLDAGALSPERLAHEMEDAVRILRAPETRRACGTLLTMMAIAEHPTIGAKEIGGYYQHFCGERIPRGMADLLRRSVGQNGFVLVPSEMKRLAAQIENTPLLTRDGILVSEFQEAAGMLRSTGANPQARGEYIQAALDHHVDMNTILEASLRGIMADQLELRAGDAILTDTRKLGQGAANTVHLCTYRGRDGEDMKLVFKPEVGARRGLDHLCASGLGYRNGARVMQLNVAASRVADAIGCGGTIARSSIGSHDGQLGLFMEAAPGKTFFDIARGKPVCRMPDGKELNFPETCRVLRSNGKLDAMRANLMRELSIQYR